LLEEGWLLGGVWTGGYLEVSFLHIQPLLPVK